LPKEIQGRKRLGRGHQEVERAEEVDDGNVLRAVHCRAESRSEGKG